MQILNRLKICNKMKKSHVLLIGSLLIFCGVLCLSWNYLSALRDEIFSDMKISMMGGITKKNKMTNPTENVENTEESYSGDDYNQPIDYGIYFGVLEIPKIRLKRGFYNIGNRYNNIQYNVTLVDGSEMPDVPNGNLILMAHSGDSYISYFAYLYRLGIGDDCYVSYNGNSYHYQIVNIYDVAKNGVVSIRRNKERNTLTLITCTKDNDSLQTVYIAEYVG